MEIDYKKLCEIEKDIRDVRKFFYKLISRYSNNNEIGRLMEVNRSVIHRYKNQDDNKRREPDYNQIIKLLKNYYKNSGEK